MEKKIVVREDLNCIVAENGIKFKTIRNKFGERHVCEVTLFNGETIEFKDSEGLFELFQSYVKCGETDFIKSKELVEELKTDDEGASVGTYICVKYVLKNEKVYRLFTTKFTSNDIIENYYGLYKKNNKVETPKK